MLRRSSEKLLLIVLALMLGFLPLKGAMAGFNSTFVQQKGMHQMEHGHAGIMAMDNDQVMDHDCPQCNDHEGCGGHSCSPGHCVSTPAIPSALSHLDIQNGLTVYLQTDETIQSHHSTHPFRPPKA